MKPTDDAATASASESQLDARRKVVKNTAILLALRVGMPMLSMAVVLAVSRLLGSEGLGRYTLAFSYLYLVNTIAPLGLYALITRDGAREPERLGAILSTSFLLGSVSSLVLTIGMVLAAGHFGYDADTRMAVAILSLAVLPSTIGTFCEGAFVARERMEHIAAVNFVENGIKVGVGVVVLFAGFGLNAVLAAAVAGRVISCLVSFELLRRMQLRIPLRIHRDLLTSFAGAAPTFLLISIFATLYWRIDVFMLSALRPVEDVGYYGAAYRLLELAMVVPQSFCLALYPQMAQVSRTEPLALAALSRTALRYLAAVTLPVALCTMLLADPLLAMLYGEDFRAAGPTLAVLIWTIVPYAWVRYHAYVLVAADRQRVDLLLNIVMSAANIGLNLVLIPAYGHCGAAIATFVAICLYGCGQYVYLHRNLESHATPLPLHPVPIVGSLLVGATAWVLADRSVILALVVIPVLYLATLLGAGFFTETELRMLRLERAAAMIGFGSRTR